MSPPLQITEDTPPDMLAGSMDLCVMLPSGHNVKMSVERSTPMMDLLVQVTTANKISPAGHVIQAMGDRGVMPYKPSTPIGALDTWTIHIVPKSQVGQSTNRKAAHNKPVSQPFEQTFRLQVHLPRNQLYVTRISPKTRLSDILIQVCSEKNLEPAKYSLRHPVNLDQVLNLTCCLADYKLQEIVLVSNRTRPLGVSSVDIMALQHTDTNNQYNYNMSRNNRSCEGSLSSGSLGGRSLSPTRSDGSSASPPPAPAPNRPLRKRRPAPKPPIANANNNNNNTVAANNTMNNNNENNTNQVEQQESSGQCPQSSTVICHSRNSSDSSGYHEASVLSESPESNSLPDSLPRRSKLPSNSSSAETTSGKVASNLSRSLSNLTTAVGNNGVRNMKTHSTSSTSLMSIGRKKKAAPLPPSLKSSKMSSVSEETQKQQRTPSVCSTASSSSATLEDNESNILHRKSSTLPASIRVASVIENSNEPETPTETHQSSPLIEEDPCSSLDLLQNTPSESNSETKTTSSSELRLDDDEIDRIFHNAMRDHTSLESGVGDEPPISLLSLPSPPSSFTNQPESATSNNNVDSLDWEYQLPAPPTFRDETSSPTVTEFDTVTIGNLTEVFGPGSILQTDNNKKTGRTTAEPDLVNTQVKKKSKKTVRINDSQDTLNRTQSVDKTELVDSKPVIIENNVDSNQDRITKEETVQEKSTVRISNDDTKPDLLKHGLEDEKRVSTDVIEKNAVIHELSTVINERLNKTDAVSAKEIENCIKTKNSSPEFQTSSSLENFVITTYKETKPIEVFEDDSVKSSNGEQRDTSRNEATFRAPKSISRRYEPNLTRRSSFSNEDKPMNVTVKRSVSHVSLLAGNVARGPYRSHIARSNGALTESACLPQQASGQIGSRLRKTTSEVNISQGNEAETESKLTDWRSTDSVGLQSLHVLRSILPQLSYSQGSVNLVCATEDENKSERVASDSQKTFERSDSEESKEEACTKPSTADKRYSYCGPPTINLSTWNERPKRQVSIKTDRDYCSGFGKLKSNSFDETETKDSNKCGETTNDKLMRLVSNSNSRFEEKPDIIKHSSDLSHVPIVRAVELKKPFSTTTVDSTDFSRCGFYNGRSYENLNFIENDVRHKQADKNSEPASPTPPSTLQSSNGPSALIDSLESSKSQQNLVCEEKFTGVNSLAKKFGQQRPRPVSCYLYGTYDQQHVERHEGNATKSANTSRVLLNSPEKKFTSIVGINGTDSKAEVKFALQKPPQQQTCRVVVGGAVPANKSVGFKLNSTVSNRPECVTSTSELVKAQSKLSSGGFVEETPKVCSVYGNKLVHTPSLKQTSNVMPVVKGFRKPEPNKPTVNQSSSSSSSSSPPTTGMMPPPPPAMPTLKPVGERRQIKMLPPPQADPRDQLLSSIRNFGGLNSLKKVSMK